MARSAIFALRDSGFSAFLFADVGIEANGSPLTVLSMLARLDEDPWEQAARWASESRATATEALAASLTGTMGISLPMDHARTIASRLMLLLPARSTIGAPDRRLPIPNTAVRRWGWLSLAFFWLYMILAAFLSPAPHLPPSVTAPRVGVTSTH